MRIPKLNDNAIVSFSSKMAEAKVCNMGNESIYKVKGLAYDLIKLIDEKHSEIDIFKKIYEKYEGSEDQINAELAKIIQKLQNLEILK